MPKPIIKIKTEHGEKVLKSDIDYRQPPRTASISIMKSAPKIDGIINDAEIKGLPMNVDMIHSKGGRLAKSQSRFYMGVIKDSLYIAIKNDESNMKKMKSTSRKRDGETWKDDCNEVFLMIDEPGNETYYQFVVSSAGSIFDGKGRDSSWNGDWKSAAHQGDNEWSTEFLIPLNVLGNDGLSVKKFRFNMCRNNAISNEYSRWSHINGSNHQPDKLGRAIRK